MDFSEIKKLVNSIKHEISCPYCNHLFYSKNIHLVSAVSLDLTFFIHCHHCLRPIWISVYLKKINDPANSSQSIKNTNANFEIKPAGAQVSTNEVLDMHNFLKNFKGDIESYLKLKP